MVHKKAAAYDWMIPLIVDLERKHRVTSTFRRLDPARQAAVVTAIFDEAVEKGPAALNIKRVAERAGVSIGSLYQYFSSREGLLDFAVAVVVRSVVDTFGEARPYLMALPLKEALAAFVNGAFEWSVEQASVARFFARAAYQDDPRLARTVVRPIAQVLRGMVRDILEQAMARGEVRRDIDLEATARVVYALTIGITDPQLLPFLNNYFQVTDPAVTRQRILEACLSLVVRGIGSESGADATR